MEMCNNVVIDSGYYVCLDTGEVVGQVYDADVFLATVFSRSSSAPRIPLNSVVHDGGFRSEMSVSDYRTTDPEKQKMYRRLSARDRRSVSREARRYIRLVKTVKAVIAAMGMNTGAGDRVLREAAVVAKALVKKIAYAEKNRVAVAAAVVYLACRRLGLPYTIKTVARAANVKVSHLARYYRLILSATGLKAAPRSPDSFVLRIASALNLPPDVSAEAVRLARLVHEYCMPQGDPAAVAAGVVYYVATVLRELGVPQVAVGGAVGLSGAAVRRWYREVEVCVEGSGLSEVLESERGEDGGEVG
ncbi:MAG: transcription initiation factor IIB family protein [Thermofilaceae archaeon]